MPRRTPVTLNHVEHGSGVPVLALHGWVPDHRLMSGCLEPLFAGRPGFRRLYPDLPGMGATPLPGEFTGSDDLLAAVEDYVDEQLGDSPFLLVGESYGGYLARALVGSRPDQVLGLALLCPVGVLDHPSRTLPPRQVLLGDPALPDGVDPALVEEFTAMAVVATAQTLRRYVTEIRPGVMVADRAGLDRIQRRWPLSVDPDTGPAYLRPTLVLTGRQDDCVGYADQFGLLDRFPRATFAALDLAGHNLQIERPALFEALMHDWLDRALT